MVCCQKFNTQSKHNKTSAAHPLYLLYYCLCFHLLIERPSREYTLIIVTALLTIAVLFLYAISYNGFLL